MTLVEYAFIGFIVLYALGVWTGITIRKRYARNKRG